MDVIKILGIVGSQRRESCNRQALLAAQELLPAGTAMELVELHGIPYFEAQRESAPPLAVVALRRRVVAADAVLFATPECNHAVPGGLQSAIDWASRPRGESAWHGKPAAVISAAAGALLRSRAQARLQLLLGELNMLAVDHPACRGGTGAWHAGAEGPLAYGPTRQFLRELLAALVGRVRDNRAINSFTFKELA